VDVDLRRPPARLGPRVPVWLPFTALVFGWVVFLVLISRVVSLPNLLALRPSATIWLLFLALNVAVVAYGVFLLTHRSRHPSDQFFPLPDLPMDLAEEPRLTDRSEREARRMLRRGEITRVHYERIIAYRQFVHGELTRQEYRARIARLADEEKIRAGNHP